MTMEWGKNDQDIWWFGWIAFHCSKLWMLYEKLEIAVNCIVWGMDEISKLGLKVWFIRYIINWNAYYRLQNNKEQKLQLYGIGYLKLVNDLLGIVSREKIELDIYSSTSRQFWKFIWWKNPTDNSESEVRPNT